MGTGARMTDVADEDLTVVRVEDYSHYEVYDIIEGGAVIDRVELLKPGVPGYQLFVRRLVSGNIEIGWTGPDD
jgi:hypothetical protein